MFDTMREKQIKTTMRQLCITIREAKINSNNTLGRLQRNWITHTLLVGTFDGAATVENSLAVS